MSRTSLRTGAALACLAIVAACATVSVQLPSITDSATGERSPGKVVWRDLLTSDPAASRQFYEALFGWEFEGIGISAGLDRDSTYTLIRHDGRLIGGMIDTVALNGRDDISQWVILLSVADIDAAVGEFRGSGGEIMTPPTDLQARGTVAVVRDAEGALLGLLETRDGDPADRTPVMGDFLWDEIWTNDTEASTSFYTGLFDLDVDRPASAGTRAGSPGYRVLKDGDAPRFGILPNPFEGLDPVWVTYIRVEDPAAITARTAALGGQVLIEAQPRPAGGTVAFIADPSGAPIALQTWPLDNAD